MRARALFVLLAVGVAYPSPDVNAQEAGVVVGEEQLRSEANPSAAVVGSVIKGSTVQVLERKGFWIRVRTGTGAGWLKLSSVSLEPGRGVSSSAISPSTTGRAGSGNVVSATGTRGLSSEGLLSARADVGAVQQLQRNAVSADDASRFASEGRLLPRNLDYVRSASGSNGSRPQPVQEIGA